MVTPTITASQIEKQYRQNSGLIGCAHKMNMISTLLGVGLFGFGVASLISPFPAYITGPVVVGAAGLAFLFQLFGGKLEKRKVDVISFALFTGALMTLGCLGTTDVLSVRDLAYCVMGIQAGAAFFYCFILRGVAAKMFSNKENQKNRSLLIETEGENL